MRLFLAAETKNPVTLQNLEHVANGLKGKKIAYIPTAANGEESWESWKKGGTWQIVKNLGAYIQIVQLEDYKDGGIKRVLDGQDIIWFAGGVPGYLMYWIRRCSLDIILPYLLEKGMLFVGSSAGSMIAGETLNVASWGFVDGERGAADIKPLGLVGFDIYPHFEESLRTKIVKNYKGRKLYLLKNEESILVEDNKVTVFGTERIIGKSRSG